VISNEQAVIAAVLLDSKVFRFAVEVIVPSDFEDARLEKLFAGVARMSANHEPIDVITVSDRLRDWDIRGITPADLHMWISELPTAQNVAWYAAKVREAALRRGAVAIATRLNQAAQSNPEIALTAAVEGIRSLRDNFSTQQLEAKPLGEVLTGDDDYDWVIQGLLERGDRMLLTGIEGGGKSTLVRQMAIMSAAGLHPFSAHRMPPVKVLVVDSENSERQWRRAARHMVQRAAILGSLNPADVLRIACVPRIDLTKDAHLAEVHRLMDDVRPDILFIGPLYRLVPHAINSDDDATPLLSALDSLRERGVAMVIEAHAGHGVGNGGERDLRPRGSSQLLGWPEFGFGLRQDKKANASNAFELIRWRGDRDERSWPTRISRGLSNDWPWTPTTSW
jgi:replicative DNA helicase